MRRPLSVLLAALFAAIPATAPAQDSTAAAPTVEAAVGTAVVDKALTGAADVFPAGTTSVSCFTKIAGAAGAEIEHVWYRNDGELSRIRLKIVYSPHRTWSTKKLPAGAAGDWRCDVVLNGKVLTSVKFKVE